MYLIASKETDQQIAKLLESAQSAGRDAATFIGEQAPELVKEIIRWGFYSNLLYVLLSVIVLICCPVCIYKIRKWILEGFETENPGPVIVLILIFGVWTFAALCFLLSVSETIKITVAPRLYLIEQIGGAVHGK